MAERLERVSLTVPSSLLAAVDDVVADADYDSRSEAIRDALRGFVASYRWRDDLDGRHQGSVVVLYDHEVAGVTDALLGLQHEFHETIVSTQHVHLSADRCLETLVVDGPANDIRELVRRIQSLRGIRQVQLAVVGDAGDEVRSVHGGADAGSDHARPRNHDGDRPGADGRGDP
jgi:CopG family nickel-responsive transcriptional regulator